VPLQRQAQIPCFGVGQFRLIAILMEGSAWPYSAFSHTINSSSLAKGSRGSKT